MSNSLQKEFKVAVVGLGYVGLPLAVLFDKKGFEVVGFDLNKNKIQQYKSGIDPTNEIGNKELSKANIIYSSDVNSLNEANFYVVTVPTPILVNKTPDLKYLESASNIVGQNLKKGDVVVYESTVYPGLTEEICIPILEQVSGLKCKVDFKIGYSPERVNPADKINTLTKIKKITSGIDEESSKVIANVYKEIIEAGIHQVSSIKVAEAAKVIENSQRDINIAFINELAVIFDKMNIDTKEVLEAAGTKWNFMPFQPGLVGGHCIGIDPYYLASKAEELGYHTQVILAGRRINDNMANFVAEKTIKLLIKQDFSIKNARILILGLTFKENCPDIRNSKIIDLITELKEYGIEDINVCDPSASKKEALQEYNIQLKELDDVKDVDAIIVAVGHNEYRQLDLQNLKKCYKTIYNKPLLVDIKGIYNLNEDIKYYTYWRL